MVGGQVVARGCDGRSTFLPYGIPGGLRRGARSKTRPSSIPDRRWQERRAAAVRAPTAGVGASAIGPCRRPPRVFDGRLGRLPRLAALWLVVAALSLAGTAAAVAAAEPSPTPSPTPRPPTCTERYPEEGPAGIDLRLACIVQELLGLGQPGDRPARISEWAGTIALLAGLGFAAFLVVYTIAGRLKRRFDRRTAPARPGAWWQCPDCRSVNGTGRATCYSCARARPPDALVLPTAETPIMVQRFGIDAARDPLQAPDDVPTPPPPPPRIPDG